MENLFGSDFMDFMVYNDISRNNEVETSNSNYYDYDKFSQEQGEFDSIFEDNSNNDF